MIFTNINLSAVEKEMEFGKIYQIILGESGRGRKEIRLTCPENTVLSKGCNFDYTIGQTKNGKHRINKMKNKKTYLLISTQGGYTRRGCGWVGSWVNNTGSYNVLANGNGADGLAGRIGYWDVLLLEVEGNPENDWIRIRTSGGGYGTDPQWVNISSKGIFLFNSTNDTIEYADSVDVEFPNIDENTRIEDLFKDVNN